MNDIIIGMGIGIFNTKNMALVAYLHLQGFIPISVNVEQLDDGQMVVSFNFDDKKGIVKSVASEFRFSDYSKYFSLVKEYRTIITRALKENIK